MPKVQPRGVFVRIQGQVAPSPGGAGELSHQVVCDGAATKALDTGAQVSLADCVTPPA